MIKKGILVKKEGGGKEMKKFLISLMFVSIFMLGCSNVSKEVEELSDQVILNFFDSMNSIEDYSNESELTKLKEYFTNDSNVKDRLVEYLNVFEAERQGESVTNIAKTTEIKKEYGLYRVTVEYDIVSKDSGSVLNQSSMYIYLKDENGQLKIETADFGG